LKFRIILKYNKKQLKLVLFLIVYIVLLFLAIGLNIKYSCRRIVVIIAAKPMAITLV
jgi:hypothetical protein